MLPFVLALLRLVRLVPRKRSLSDLDPVTLRCESIKFEQAERRIGSEIAKLEVDKDNLFKLGSTDVTDRERQRIARKIKQIDQIIASRDRNLALLNRNLHVVESLTQLLENQVLVKKFGVSKGLLAKIDIDDIKQYVDDSTIEGQVSMERLASLLAATDNANAVFVTDGEPDADEQQLIELMRAAATSAYSTGPSPARPSVAQSGSATGQPLAS